MISLARLACGALVSKEKKALATHVTYCKARSPALCCSLHLFLDGKMSVKCHRYKMKCTSDNTVVDFLPSVTFYPVPCCYVLAEDGSSRSQSFLRMPPIVVAFSSTTPGMWVETECRCHRRCQSCPNLKILRRSRSERWRHVRRCDEKQLEGVSVSDSCSFPEVDLGGENVGKRGSSRSTTLIHILYRRKDHNCDIGTQF